MANMKKNIGIHPKKKSKNKENGSHDGNGRNKYTVALSLFILFLMVGSTFGFIMYYWTEDKKVFEYEGFKLENLNNRWFVVSGDKKLEFYNHPTQVENIELPTAVIVELMDGNPIYVTFDPDVPLTVAQSLDQVRLDLSISINTLNAVTKVNSDYPLPVIDCSNTTGSYNDGNTTKEFERNIIYLKKGNDTRITVDNKCVIIESRDGQGFIDLKDRLVYGLYGIIKLNTAQN
jgi:hypothetical protein